MSYAVLTDSGYAKLRESAPTHLESIRAGTSLAELLACLSSEGAVPLCSPSQP